VDQRGRKSIEFYLNQQNTDVLYQIWNTHDSEEWRDEAFEVMEEILFNRTGEMPIHSNERNLVLNKEGDSLADDQPVFYEPDEVDIICKWLSRTWIVAAGISFIITLSNFESTYLKVYSWFFSDQSAKYYLAIVSLVSIIMFAKISLSFLLFYFPFKALGQVLKILKEMEFNSRKI